MRLEVVDSCGSLDQGCHHAPEKFGKAPARFDGLDDRDDGRFGFLAALAWDFKCSEKQEPSRVATTWGSSRALLENATPSPFGRLYCVLEDPFDQGVPGTPEQR
jgi:hypothetical protein